MSKLVHGRRSGEVGAVQSLGRVLVAGLLSFIFFLLFAKLLQLLLLLLQLLLSLLLQLDLALLLEELLLQERPPLEEFMIVLS